MRVIRGRRNITESDQGCVVTIGNFDGVHLGHQAILAAVKSQATKDGVDSMLVCFEPQPKEFFDEFKAPARLTRFAEKVECLSQHGVDRILCMKFNEATRSMSGDAFVRFVVDELVPKAVFVGDDFRFGADRSGGFDALKRAGNQHGFLVSDFGTITEGAQRVSSTRIRACLSEGRFEEAKALWVARTRSLDESSMGSKLVERSACRRPTFNSIVIPHRLAACTPFEVRLAVSNLMALLMLACARRWKTVS